MTVRDIQSAKVQNIRRIFDIRLDLLAILLQHCLSVFQDAYSTVTSPTASQQVFGTGFSSCHSDSSKEPTTRPFRSDNQLRYIKHFTLFNVN